jgi:hypothetical protein
MSKRSCKKNTYQRSGLICRPQGRLISLLKAALPPKAKNPIQIGDSSLKSLWPFSLVQNTRDHRASTRYTDFLSQTDHIFGFWALSFI